MVLAGSITMAMVLACSPAAVAPTTPGPTPTSASLGLVSPSATTAPTPSSTLVQTAGPVVTPIAGAPDSGVVVHLVAKTVGWDVTTISAPAGKVWHVEIENRDATGSGVPHNFVVETGPDVALRIFNSPRVQGGQTQTFEVPGIPAGTYTFVCTLHRNTMTGQLILK